MKQFTKVYEAGRQCYMSFFILVNDTPSQRKNEVAKSNSVINVSLILFVFVFRTPTSHTLFFYIPLTIISLLYFNSPAFLRLVLVQVKQNVLQRNSTKPALRGDC